MKFISGMHKLTVALLLIICGNFAMAQQTAANSPFSSFGLGELGGLDHQVFSGIGNSTITLQDSTVLNYYNPASYNTLAKGQPLISVGMSSRLSTYTENGGSSFQNITTLQHFAMAFPFAKRFGLAFGLKPYSRRGYQFSSRQKVDSDSIYYNYSGSGNINDLFLGFSAEVMNVKGARISLGGNFGFLFGNALNTRKAGLIQSNVANDDYSGGVSIKGFRARSFHYELGLQYDQRINEHHSIGISAVADPLQKIQGSYEDGLYYSGNVNNPNAFDTLSFEDRSGNITNVPTYTFGLKYTLNKLMRKDHTNPLNSELSVHLTYTMYDWSKFDNSYDPNYVNDFENANKYTLGLQFVPETDFIANKVTTKFYHRMRYRIGGYYQTLPYQINGTQVDDFGITFGFGFPIVIQNSLSSINLGLNYGNRGVAESQSLNEQYYGINVGLIIAPNPKTDRWFRKHKLN